MKFGMEMINDITEKIDRQILPYVDCVVVGDNSSGKTLLLKTFIEKVKENKAVYFIDAVNRGFDVKKITKTERKPEYKKTILETRLQELYFNLIDSFNCYGTLTERIEVIYQIYEEEVQRLFYEFTEDRFGIPNDNILGEVDFGDGRGLLSSGYQAIVRILLELLYYQDMEINKKCIQEAWIVIDELDEYLSPRYSAMILEFLKKKFVWGRWIVTTHSCDLVSYTQDANLLILKDTTLEVLDINDYRSVLDVQIIFERLFRHPVVIEPQIEDVLRRLLNNKMNHAWSEYDEDCLIQIERNKLTASQQIIIQQIREW